MSKPIDIDIRELVLYHRQKRIVKKLLKVSAEEIASIISQLVVENCNGCMTEHLSNASSVSYDGKRRTVMSIL
jgi:hypothetical protein